jgi:hypothetical protein
MTETYPWWVTSDPDHPVNVAEREKQPRVVDENAAPVVNDTPVPSDGASG